MKKIMVVSLTLTMILVLTQLVFSQVNPNLRIHQMTSYWIWDGEPENNGTVEFHYDDQGQLENLSVIENYEDVQGRMEVVYDDQGNLSELNAYDTYDNEDELVGSIEINHQDGNPIRLSIIDQYADGIHFTLKYDTTIQSQLYQDILSLFGLTGQMSGVFTTINYQEGDPLDPDFSSSLEFEYSKNGVLERVTVPQNGISLIVRMVYGDQGNLTELRGESSDGEYFGSIELEYEEDRIVQINFTETDGSVSEYIEIEYLELE